MPTGDEIPDLGRKTDRPQLNLAADLSQVRLTPTEGFILSRVDGRMSYDDICKVSSLGREQTLAILRKLKQQQLILAPGTAVATGNSRQPPATAEPRGATAPAGAPKGARSRSAVREAAAEKVHPPPAVPARKPDGPVAPSKPASTERAAPRTAAPEATLVTAEMLREAQERAQGKIEAEQQATAASLLERLDDGSPVDAAALAEGRDLPDETKRRICRLHRRLRTLEPHQLLGVDAAADLATIKRAFAAASKELHPDRYFGKDLGHYRDKLAQIFARLTEAMQALQKARKMKQ